MNITLVWEGKENDKEKSNILRVYIGDSKGVDMGDSALKIVGGEL